MRSASATNHLAWLLLLLPGIVLAAWAIVYWDTYAADLAYHANLRPAALLAPVALLLGIALLAWEALGYSRSARRTALRCALAGACCALCLGCLLYVAWRANGYHAVG